MIDAANIVTINMYFEPVPEKENGLAAITFPGFSVWSTINAFGSEVRTLLTHKDIVYAVVGNKLYSIASNGTKTELGTLSTSAGRLGVATISDQILLADGTSVYSYKPSTTTFSTVSDVDLPSNVSKIASVSGYILYVQPNSTTVYASDLNNGSSIGALSFFTANQITDSIQNILGIQNLVYIFGQKETAIWYNSGGQTIPFDPYATENMEIGLAAPYTAIKVLDRIFWLGADKSGIVGLVSAKGLDYQIIDNKAFLEDINNASTTALSNAFAITETHDGHVFYIITVPRDGDTAGFTYTYDITTNTWSSRTSYNILATPLKGYDRYIANCQTKAYGKQLIGDYQKGVIYEFTNTDHDEAGTEISRELISPNINANDAFFSVYNLEIDIENNLATASITDPDLSIYISKDRGRTWSNEITRSVAKVGEYKRRVRVLACGGGYNFKVRVVMTDPVAWKVLGATAEIELQDR